MPADILYDAFISYNQKLDKPFVRRLQRQLQNLGKAWWQRRAVRIFRDESSLSATPELWPAIVRAMEQSRFLIVCASPEAAASHWVNEEVRWWLTHKSPNTPLIALTAGELSWDRTGNDFAWNAATPLPPAFKGAFATEPKWTDFRAYRSLEENARADNAFLALAADLSSTIRGIPKEDLLSEEVRQQRRALRTAYGGAGFLACTAAVAAWLGYIAYQQAIETRQQRDIAYQLEIETRKQRDEVFLTQSRFLADQAARQRDGGDVVTGLLLAVAALPDKHSTDRTIKERPYWFGAEVSLEGTRRRVRRFFELAHGGGVLSAAFSPDGRRIVTASKDGTARVWDTETGKPLGEPMRHKGVVWSAAFSPDGCRIVTAWGNEYGNEGDGRIWDADTGRPLGEPMRHEQPVWSAVFSPDGRRIVTASGDGTARVWDAETGKPQGKPMRHEDNAHSAVFSPDGRRIVTTSADMTARVWDAETGKPLGKPLRHKDIVTSAAFSPDGRRVVTASDDKTARIWDAETGKTLGEPLRHEEKVISAVFSPDGRRVVTASNDGTARLWEAETGKPLSEPLRHEGPVESAAFSPDGRRIVTASQDSTARVWDAETGKPLIEPLRHENNVVSAVFSPDGRRIATTSDDKTARVWVADTGEPLAEPLRHTDAVWSAAFSPDGRRIVTASEDKTARIWDAETGKLSRPCSRAFTISRFSRRALSESSSSFAFIKKASKPPRCSTERSAFALILRRTPRVSIEHARRQIELYGRDNPFVKVKILGEFPDSDFKALIGPDEVEAAMRRHYRAHEIGNAAKVLGVDVARSGLAASALCPRQGIQCFPIKKYRNLTSTQGAGIVSRTWSEFGAHACFVDATGGFGAGWVDQLHAIGRAPVGIQFSGRPHNPNRYHNKRAEMAFEAIEWIRRGGALPEDRELFAILTQTNYDTPKDKVLLEPKEDIEERLGYSLDSFDSFILTFAEPVAVPDPLARSRRNAVLEDYQPYAEHAASGSYDDPYR